MIECTSKNGVKVYVTRTYDVEPNKGGFYCAVYLDENCDRQRDNRGIVASKVKDTHGDNKYANQYFKVIDFVNKYFANDEQH
jgi:hypothetical protein